MKFHTSIKILVLLLLFPMIFCECSKGNDTEPFDISNCNLTVASGSIFSLYTPKRELLATFKIQNNISVLGTKTKYLNHNKTYYSFKGLKLTFDGYTTMNEISFEIQDEKITWLHSDDSQSAFFGEGYNLSSTNNADTIYFFNDTKTSYQFSYSTDIYSTQLSGQIIIK